MLVQNRTWLHMIAALLLTFCGAAKSQQELDTVGLAVYTETARDIYLAALKLPADAGLENVYLMPGPKAMEYRIATRRISSRGFSGTLLLQAEFGSGERADDRAIEALNTLKKDIQGSLRRGDRFVIYLSEDDETSFYLNDTELLTGADGSVFDFFFAGWVGDSSSALFRESLLAGDVSRDMRQRFDTLTPTEERMALVADWKKQPVPAPAPKPRPEPAPVESAPAVVESAPVAVAAAASVTPPPTADTAAAAAAGGAPQAETPVAADPAAALSVATAEKQSEPPPAESEAVVEDQPAQLAMAEPVEEPVAQEPESAAADAAPLDDREYQRELGTYVSDIMRKVFGNVKYPKRAIKRDREGKVELLAHLDADGKLMDVTLDASSGYSSLDEAARKAVKMAAPFPELTQAAKEEFLSDSGEGYVMPIPITFRLQQ